ncbi:MAG: Holliday junction branch migration protein RuvA [Puniceicoccaceae bacterium]|nr:MAG: Holliday junction branch migration protein RuvA [Puniceicoccaceae bacterium]
MIAYLKGTVLEATPLEMVLDVQGVGYVLHMPVTTAEKIPGIGEPCELFIHSVYREDSAALYAFIHREDRDFFRLLIEKVSGIGPRIALSILSKMSVSLLQKAIYNQDTSLLSQCPGIGKKTAERLIIELKDKVVHSTGPSVNPDISTQTNSDYPSSKYQDAVSSLMTLGYKLPDADKRVSRAIRNLGSETSTESIIKEALGA